MWWFRAQLLLFLCLVPSACGFTPLHRADAGAAVSAVYRDIEIPSIPDRDGQFLRNLLIDRLYVAGRPADAKYALEVDPLTTTLADLGIQKDATVTRTQIEIGAHVRLREKETGKVLLERTLRAVGGYDVLDTQYTTIVTRRSATGRILEELADAIVTEMNLHFRRAS